MAILPIPIVRQLMTVSCFTSTLTIRATRKYIIADIAERVEIDTVELTQLLIVRSRRAALEDFRKLLVNEGGYRVSYRTNNAAAIKGSGGEAIWHHFLSANKWIFGLSLDLRFIEDFVDEASVGIGDTANHGNPKVDVLAWSDYTILIELKTPDSNIFYRGKDAGGSRRHLVLLFGIY